MDEVQVLRAEIDQLRSERDGRRSTRRNMLRLTGAAVAGGAVAAIANGGSASAIVANPVLMGRTAQAIGSWVVEKSAMNFASASCEAKGP